MKLAKGERRPSRVNYQEPALPTVDQAPEPPAGLASVGKAEWKALARHLTKAGVLTLADLTALENYCRSLSDLRRYEASAKRAGPELAIAKGYQGMVVKLRAQCSQLAQQFGLTPSSRSTVKALKKPGEQTASPAERYLRAISGGKPGA